MESQRPGAPSAQASSHAGIWDGEYVDANGYRGRLKLTIEGDETIRGQYELAIRSEDAPHVIKGDLEGRKTPAGLQLAVPVGRDKSRVEFEVQVRPAGSYAQKAMVGIVSQPLGTNFGGGVWIAWRFANKQRRG